jgi:hypothetical protein
VKRWTHGRYLSLFAKIVPFCILFQPLTCLPDNAVAQVFGENIVFTFAVVLQTVTSVVFNTIFGVA